MRHRDLCVLCKWKEINTPQSTDPQRGGCVMDFCIEPETKEVKIFQFHPTHTQAPWKSVHDTQI